MTNPMELIRIRQAAPSDSNAIAAIYNHYVTTSIITFEEKPVTPEQIAERIDQVQSASLPWLVAEVDSQVKGYAFVKPWKSRSAYRFSVETTAYASPQHSRCGLGSKLYEELLPILRARHIHSVIGGIALPNEASVAFHEKFGFRKAAHFYEVGFKFNRWIDVGYWQLTL
jgi:L-amino acid N-acyltransferase YncA